MIKKEECIIGTIAVVNDKVTQWNKELGTKFNGLICFPFNEKGTLMGNELEVKVGTKITIQSKPKRFNGNGNQVKFTVDGDNNIYSSYWISFKHKINKTI